MERLSALVRQDEQDGQDGDVLFIPFIPFILSDMSRAPLCAARTGPT